MQCRMFISLVQKCRISFDNFLRFSRNGIKGINKQTDVERNIFFIFKYN